MGTENTSKTMEMFTLEILLIIDDQGLDVIGGLTETFIMGNFKTINEKDVVYYDQLLGVFTMENGKMAHNLVMEH